PVTDKKGNDANKNQPYEKEKAGAEGTGEPIVEHGSTPLEYRYALDPNTDQLINFKWLETRKVDPVADAYIIDRVSELKSRLSKTVLKKGGNFGYAEVDIPTVNQREFYASSQVDFSSGNPNLNGFSFLPDDPVFNATKAPDNKGSVFERLEDSEYKIMNDLAQKIGYNPNATGKVKIFTERDTCASCNNIIGKFKERYPRIEIEVIHNSGNLVPPKELPKPEK
ncbi:deaminase domain-containing protein, partial [Brevibacillus parabrevis]